MKPVATDSAKIQPLLPAAPLKVTPLTVSPGLQDKEQESSGATGSMNQDKQNSTIGSPSTKNEPPAPVQPLIPRANNLPALPRATPSTNTGQTGPGVQTAHTNDSEKAAPQPPAFSKYPINPDTKPESTSQKWTPIKNEPCWEDYVLPLGLLGVGGLLLYDYLNQKKNQTQQPTQTQPASNNSGYAAVHNPDEAVIF